MAVKALGVDVLSQDYCCRRVMNTIGKGCREEAETSEKVRKRNQKNMQHCCYLKPKEEKVSKKGVLDASEIVRKLPEEGPLHLARKWWGARPRLQQIEESCLPF